MRVDLPPDRPRVSVVLADGHEATLSPLVPEDREFLEDGLEHLSLQSRFTRFGWGLGHLSNRELDYLSNIDQRAHVAWGARIDAEGAGVGRYVRLSDTASAEIAVTVLDEHQRRGLGTLLFRALTAVARADGIEEFRFVAVPGNAAVEKMILGLDVSIERNQALIEGNLRIETLPGYERDEEFVSVMEQVRG